MILIEKVAGVKKTVGLIGAGAAGGALIGHGVGKKRGAKIERGHSRIRERLSFHGGRAHAQGKWPEFLSAVKKRWGNK